MTTFKYADKVRIKSEPENSHQKFAVVIHIYSDGRIRIADLKTPLTNTKVVDPDEIELADPFYSEVNHVIQN